MACGIRREPCPTALPNVGTFPIRFRIAALKLIILSRGTDGSREQRSGRLSISSTLHPVSYRDVAELVTGTRWRGREKFPEFLSLAISELIAPPLLNYAD